VPASARQAAAFSVAHGPKSIQSGHGFVSPASEAQKSRKPAETSPSRATGFEMNISNSDKDPGYEPNRKGKLPTSAKFISK
jgi:hypothetical protein